MIRSALILEQLRRYESRNITFRDPDGSWPIVWARARGVHVWDSNGKKYLDLTAAFGVASAGHANRQVVRAGQKQMTQLLHGMGDVHPHALKARLARTLSELTFERWSNADGTRKNARRPSQAKHGKPARAGQVDERWGHELPMEKSPHLQPLSRPTGEGGRRPGEGQVHGKVIFCNSGFEAVEAALKTALLATGKAEVIAFEGAYHGTGYGTLNTTHRQEFRGPFRAQLGAFVRFVPFPGREPELDPILEKVDRLLRQGKIGAVLAEPVQGRGGIRVPPASFLSALRALCDQHRALLILDEVFTGFGRTGAWFACERFGVLPDLICLGKALTGGFPLSACVGKAALMDAAWPACTGEAIHTSTYLGHPVGCAMALAQIEEIRRRELVRQSRELGDWLVNSLQTGIARRDLKASVRGLGLMVGVEAEPGKDESTVTQSKRIWHLVKQMLRRGYLLLPEGAHGQVAAITPPLIITRPQLAQAIDVFCDLLGNRKTAAGRATTSSA